MFVKRIFKFRTLNRRNVRGKRNFPRQERKHNDLDFLGRVSGKEYRAHRYSEDGNM